MDKILEIKNLSIQFRRQQETVRAVEDVTLDIYAGEILALAGESGSGKTVTALSITRLLAENAEIVRGEIIFQGRDLLKASQKEMENIRGKDISYVFQEAQASLNPVLTIGSQISEGIIRHQNKSPKEAGDLAGELLRLARLPHPGQILKSYPHQLSGGENQRVMLAMAVAAAHCAATTSPKLLIADEPTTALDVTIEAQIIRMLLELKGKFNFSILFITHNLALARRFADRIAIMYQGKIVESAGVKEIFLKPKHLHTQELVNSIIRL